MQQHRHYCIAIMFGLRLALAAKVSWLQFTKLPEARMWHTFHQQMVQLSFDSPIFLNEQFELECRFGLNHKQLYSIKWYKDEQEFFEFVPHETPQARFFASKGVRFETPAYAITNDTFRIWLQGVTLDSQGVYRCEISTDAPEFITLKDHKTLEVYVLPSKSPRITGSRASFLLKSRVDLNCSSPKSKPVSDLQWFINDKLAPSDYLIQYALVNHSDGLQSQTLRLKFVVNEDHFKYGNMKLKCLAIYKKLALDSNETVIRRNSKWWPKKSPSGNTDPNQTVLSSVESGGNTLHLYLVGSLVLGNTIAIWLTHLRHT